MSHSFAAVACGLGASFRPGPPTNSFRKAHRAEARLASRKVRFDHVPDHELTRRGLRAGGLGSGNRCIKAERSMPAAPWFALTCRCASHTAWLCQTA